MVSQAPFYLCPECGAKSYNPYDIVQRYCGGCHQFEQIKELLKSYERARETRATERGERPR